MLNECLGLYNKPKAEVHLGHKLTGPKEEETSMIPWRIKPLTFQLVAQCLNQMRPARPLQSVSNTKNHSQENSKPKNRQTLGISLADSGPSSKTTP